MVGGQRKLRNHFPKVIIYNCAINFAIERARDDNDNDSENEGDGGDGNVISLVHSEARN